MKRFPSADRIQRATQCDRPTALAIRRLIDGRMSPADVLGDVDPYRNSIEARLEAINHLLDLHGIEAVRGDGWHHFWTDSAAVYVNTGEMYAGTIIFDVERQTWYAMDLGTWIEVAERNGRLTLR